MMTTYYVATLASYVLVEATDEAEARAKGERGLRDLLGADYPLRVRILRPATEEEIELQRWYDEGTSREQP